MLLGLFLGDPGEQRVLTAFGDFAGDPFEDGAPLRGEAEGHDRLAVAIGFGALLGVLDFFAGQNRVRR